MALSNILQPNDYNLFCNSITGSGSFNSTKTTYQFNFLQVDQSIVNSSSRIVVYDMTSPLYPGTPTLPYTYLNGTFTMIRPALVNIIATIKWEAINDTTLRLVTIYRNNDVYRQVENIFQNNNQLFTTGLAGQTIPWAAHLQVGETFRVEVFQNSGSPINIQGVLSSPAQFCNLIITTNY